MNRLSDRLARFKPGLPKSSLAIEDTQSLVELLTEKTAQKTDVSDDLSADSISRLRAWELMPTPHGKAHVYRETLPCPAPPALADLSYLLGDKRLHGFSPDNALYLDIEATGLSHGAGTFAFLIGCAYYEGTGADRRLILEQLFMTNPENEMPVLGYFLKLLYRFEYLVSFNGKSYDLSVLQNRLILTRLLSQQEGHIKLRPHLDLLHSCRLPYGGVFANTKLQTLEREVLRIPAETRENDVPGSLVPSLYFHYLRTGYASVLDVVLTHNRTDVLSMVALTTHLIELLRQPISTLQPLVSYNLGRAALRFKQPDRAVELLKQAISTKSLGDEVYMKAVRHLITAARRVGLYDLAATHTEDLALAVETSDPAECARLLRLALRYRKKQ